MKRTECKRGKHTNISVEGHLDEEGKNEVKGRGRLTQGVNKLDTRSNTARKGRKKSRMKQKWNKK